MLYGPFVTFGFYKKYYESLIVGILFLNSWDLKGLLPIVDSGTKYREGKSETTCVWLLEPVRQRTFCIMGLQAIFSSELNIR